jgi:thiol-disulfide isomerase/thioredoxin
MTGFSSKSRPHPLATLSLVALSCLPLPAKAEQEGGQRENKPGAAPTSPLGNPLSSDLLKLPSLEKNIDLPQRVLDKAAEKGINPATIKLEQGKWLECTDKSCTVLLEATKEEIQRYNKPEVIKGLRTGESLSITGHTYSTHRVEADKNYGIPGLGSFTTEADGTRTFTPDVNFKGTVTRDNKAATNTGKAESRNQGTTTKNSSAEVVEVSYSKDDLKKIHDRLTLELDTTFVFVISVPSQCPPCRTYKQELKNAAAQYSRDSKVAFVTINFDSFEQARQVMGDVTLFPTTIVMPAIKSDTFTYEYDANWAAKPFLQAIKRPGYQVEGVKQPGPLRDIVSQTLKVPKEALRGVTRSLKELLGAGR